jgi:hypothetical protein
MTPEEKKTALSVCAFGAIFFGILGAVLWNLGRIRHASATGGAVSKLSAAQRSKSKKPKRAVE